jgi:hypothetical protein
MNVAGALGAIGEAALVLLLVDFVSGLHHLDGTALLAKGWLASSWDLLAAGAVVVAVAWWAGRLDWHVWLFAAVGANANQLHKWNHSGRALAPWPA